MAFSLSVKKIAPMCAFWEAASGYGVRPVILPQTHGFFTAGSPNPAKTNQNYEAPDYNAADWSPQKVIPTDRSVNLDFRVPFQGGELAAATSPPRYRYILTCCGLVETVGASNVTYRQALPTELETTTAGSLSKGSSTIAVQLGGQVTAGWVHEVTGFYGNMRLRLPWKGMPMIEIAGRGIYKGVAAGTLHGVLGGTLWSGGPQKANKFSLQSANKLTINDGAGAYTMVGKEVVLDLGIKTEDVGDFNSGATGNILRQALVDSSEPRLTLTMALDGDPTALVSYKDLYDDADDGTTHAITGKYTDLAGKTVQIDCAAAQVLTVEPDLDGDHRTCRVTYKPTGATPYLLTYAN